MLYSFQNSFLFAHVARTGGVSLAEALRIAAPNFRNLGVQHAPLAEARVLLGPEFETVFKFAFVRNPWSRLVSWQGFLAATTAGPEAEPQALADPDAPHWRDFDALVETVTRETVEVDGVPRPMFSQFHQLADAGETLLADHVGRFETLTEDAAEIFARIGLRMPALAHENRSAHHAYGQYYSDAAREMVAAAFTKDIAAFGYSFEEE